jgi:hypothetical protein
MNKPIMRDPMDSEEAGILYICKLVNATPVEIKNLKYNLMDSIECNFSERECNLLYTLAGCDLLNSSESKTRKYTHTQGGLNGNNANGSKTR